MMDGSERLDLSQEAEERINRQIEYPGLYTLSAVARSTTPIKLASADEPEQAAALLDDWDCLTDSVGGDVPDSVVLNEEQQFRRTIKASYLDLTKSVAALTGIIKQLEVEQLEKRSLLDKVTQEVSALRAEEGETKREKTTHSALLNKTVHELRVLESKLTLELPTYYENVEKLNVVLEEMVRNIEGLASKTEAESKGLAARLGVFDELKLSTLKAETLAVAKSMNEALLQQTAEAARSSQQAIEEKIQAIQDALEAANKELSGKVIELESKLNLQERAQTTLVAELAARIEALETQNKEAEKIRLLAQEASASQLQAMEQRFKEQVEALPEILKTTVAQSFTQASVTPLSASSTGRSPVFLPSKSSTSSLLTGDSIELAASKLGTTTKSKVDAV